MNHGRVYAFVAGIWALMIAGGGIVVLVLGPIRAEGADPYAALALSAAKAAVAILLVAVWVLVMIIVKRKIFAMRQDA